MGVGGEVSLNLKILRRGGGSSTSFGNPGVIRDKNIVPSIGGGGGGWGGRDVDFSGITYPTNPECWLTLHIFLPRLTELFTIS